MKSLIYILLIGNLILLAVNWDSGGSEPKAPGQQDIPALLIAGEDAGAQEFPQADVWQKRGAVLQVLDAFFGIIAGLWDAFTGLFASDYYVLPTDFTEPPEPPTPPPPPEPLACYDLAGYASRAAAATDQELLNIYGVKAALETSSRKVEKRQYQVIIRSRYSLEIAEQLSESLSGSSVPNSIKEWAPQRYRLETPVYKTKAEADAIYKKTQDLGYSSELVPVGGAATTEVATYYLRIKQEQSTKWEEQARIITPQLGKNVKITELESC